MNKDTINAYISMTKPNIALSVLITTVWGFYFAKGGIYDVSLLFWTLFGTALSCGGSSVLNQYLERDVDALMQRTKYRAIPTGMVSPNNALYFGIVLVLTGVFTLIIKVNLLTAFLCLLTAFLYVLVYTPMKRLSWLNTTIGAIPGALPTIGGWAAASNSIEPGAWILFFILFTWQHPHFFAISWMYKEDYKKAGFKMLPCVYPDGFYTFAHMMSFCFACIAFSLMPTMIGMSGKIYFWGALSIGLLLIIPTLMFWKNYSILNARKVLAASIIYLPLLLFFIILDAIL